MRQRISQLQAHMMQLPRSIRRLIWLVAITPSLLFMPLIWVLYRANQFHAEVYRLISANHEAGVPLARQEGILNAFANSSDAFIVLTMAIIIAGITCGVFAILMGDGKKSAAATLAMRRE